MLVEEMSIVPKRGLLFLPLRTEDKDHQPCQFVVLTEAEFTIFFMYTIKNFKVKDKVSSSTFTFYLQIGNKKNVSYIRNYVIMIY